MNVDTGEFRALTEQAGQVAALGRKISALTGRLTVMGNHLNRLDTMVDADLGIISRLCADMFRRIPEASRPVPREPARHAAPREKRHLHLVRD